MKSHDLQSLLRSLSSGISYLPSCGRKTDHGLEAEKLDIASSVFGNNKSLAPQSIHVLRVKNTFGRRDEN